MKIVLTGIQAIEMNAYDLLISLGVTYSYDNETGWALTLPESGYVLDRVNFGIGSEHEFHVDEDGMVHIDDFPF